MPMMFVKFVGKAKRVAFKVFLFEFFSIQLTVPEKGIVSEKNEKMALDSKVEGT
jgi:hypothetical protein